VTGSRRAGRSASGGASPFASTPRTCSHANACRSTHSSPRPSRRVRPQVLPTCASSDSNTPRFAKHVFAADLITRS
jgi:hypothetical protein